MKEREAVTENADRETDANTKSARIRKEVFSWCRCIIIGCLLAVILTQFVIVNATVPTGSMLDTIQKKDRLIALRTAYWFSSPDRGEIVVFDPEDFEGQHLIKRVIGLPGETVEGKDGFVYIDEKKLEEPYVREALREDFGPFEVPEDSYFMMGDNRNDSLDSRYWEHPFVNKKDILGKAVFRYYPGVSAYHDPNYEENCAEDAVE